MDQKTVAALAERVSPYVRLGNARRETLSLLVLGLLSARTTNLSVLACERNAAASTASTYRRLQRFFQHAEPGADWAAPVVAGLARLGPGPHRLILDRTNWKIGRREVNLLVLAVATRRHRLALMWTVLDRPGNSGAADRIALIERYLARFGAESIGLLLADREFIGDEWFNWLIQNDIPFAIRMRGTQRATTVDNRKGPLARLLAAPGGRRRATVTLNRMARDGTPGPALAVRALRPRDRSREAVIVATNRPGIDALGLYRRRWDIELVFADAKTRGLNLEDTRLTCARKLDLLMALVALALAWASATAAALLGRRRLPRKSHGYPAKSAFRIGFESLRRLLRTEPLRTLDTWQHLSPHPIVERVV
jgi:hypothetical protein